MSAHIAALPSSNLNDINIEFIDTQELSRRLNVPKTWVEDQCRTRCADKIPHFKLGKYTRFAWGSQPLTDWLNRRKVVVNSAVKRVGI